MFAVTGYTNISAKVRKKHKFMTPSQLHILQHSLGLDKYGKGTMYRNRYVITQGCDTWDDCKSLCDLGFMIDKGPCFHCGGMNIFHVTNAGKEAVKRESPIRVGKRTSTSDETSSKLKENICTKHN